MSDSSFYPPVSFSFQLSIDGDNAAFQEASGISMETNVEEVSSGGGNQFKYKVPGVANYTNLVLKRGLVSKDSSIWKWCDETMSGGLTEPIKPKQIVVQLLDAERKVLMFWTFYVAYPVKWTVSEFKSLENSYVVESLEFAFNYFEAKK